MRDFGTTLARRPGFSPDGAWIVAGPQVLRFATGTVRTHDPATTIARFMPDGRIAAGMSDGRVTIYCPKRGP
jgi:hypothetical protein